MSVCPDLHERRTMSAPSETDLPTLARILLDNERQDDNTTTPTERLAEEEESVISPATSALGLDTDNNRVSVFTVSCPLQAGGCATKSTASLSEVPPGPSTDDLVESTVNAPVDLAFDELSYSVNTIVGLCCVKKRILHELCGEFRAGQLTAIMGPSGAGKSTLLNVVSGYTSSGMEGRLLVNGEPRDDRLFQRAYIQQDVKLYPQLTVKEIMNVAALLKLGRNAALVKKTIVEVLKSMGLIEQADTMTGRLSGGELKRLATALELITNPSVMFFDEPTSGLDSSTSTQCVQLLKRLSRQGRTIVCTLHQPSASIFDLLDHLYLLVDGRCAYRGTPSNVVPFLSKIGFTCPPYHNPADYALEVAGGEFGDHADTLVKAIDNGSCTLWTLEAGTSSTDTPDWLKTPASCSSTSAISYESSSSTEMVLSSRKKASAPFKFPTSFWLQFCILFKRSLKRTIRDRVLGRSRIFIHLVSALFIGLIFWDIGNDAANVTFNYRFLFFGNMFLMFTALSGMISAFPLEMPIVARENFNRWHSLGAYYLAVTLADVPMQGACNIAYSSLSYFMTSQPPELHRFLRVVLICALISFVAQGIGLIIGAAMKVELGVLCGPVVAMPFCVFSGFFISKEDAPDGFGWLFDISFLRIGVSGCMLAVYGYDREPLSCSEGICMASDPEMILSQQGLANDSYWMDVIILVVAGCVLRVVSFAVLSLRVKYYR